MNILITLDYELFFGNAGTPEKSIIAPTNTLIELAEKYDFKCVFFIDIGYLIRLKNSFKDYPKLKEDYTLVSDQIKNLSKLGHEIQLHIHPHWEDSFYNGESWEFNLDRYRLSDFNQKEIARIVVSYKKELETIIGKEVFTFRAGGWCIQPFEKLRKVFIENNLVIDSTVFYNGRNVTRTQWYDFRNSPKKTEWRFDHDVCVEVDRGFFQQIPISSIKVSPIFFWKFIFLKFFGGNQYKSYGDGKSSGMSKIHALKLLMFSSNTVVSMDGIKAGLLKRAFKKSAKKHKEGNFVVIGHPKAFSEYSLNKFEEFIKSIKISDQNRIVTYKFFYKH